MKKCVLSATGIILLVLLTACSNASSGSAADISGPSAPGAPVITILNQAVELDWSPVTDAVSYQVWFDDSSNVSLASQQGGVITGTTYTITGLTNGTPYSVWLKAVSNAGTSSFSVPATGTPLGVPVVAAKPGSNGVLWQQLRGTSVGLQATITNAGDSTITTRGFCWSDTNPTPGISDSSQIVSGTHTTYNATIMGLTANTKYYIRPFATNTQGTGYGSVFSIDSGYFIDTTTPGKSVRYNDGYGNGLFQGALSSSTMVWISGGDTQTTLNGKTQAGFGYGLVNSYSITAQPGHVESAARYCLDYSDDGYDDWYLPSTQEGMYMYVNGGNNWSSSEADATYATGLASQSRLKTYTGYSVVPVRSFYRDNISRPYFISVESSNMQARNTVDCMGPAIAGYAGETIQLIANAGYTFAGGAVPAGWTITADPQICIRTMQAENLTVTDGNVISEQ